jgi:hypothetical protein
VCKVSPIDVALQHAGRNQAQIKSYPKEKYNRKPGQAKDYRLAFCQTTLIGGFSLCEKKDEVGVRVHEKSLKRFKDKLKEITSRKRSRTITQILQELTRSINGWLGYYSIADVKKYLIGISKYQALNLA